MPRIFSGRGSGRGWPRACRSGCAPSRMFLADIYNEGGILADGVVPDGAVPTSSGFRREVYGVKPENGVRIHVAGIDLVRDEDGCSACSRTTSDARRGSTRPREPGAMARMFPELFGGQPHPHGPRLRGPLGPGAPPRRAPPGGPSRPPWCSPLECTSAYDEHSLLARLMGLHLVEGRDLLRRGTSVYLRTTTGRAVDIIYRRVDDEYVDPVQFRRKPCSAVPALSTRRGPGGSRLRTPSATAWPTTSSSTPTSRTWSPTTSARSRCCGNVDTFPLRGRRGPACRGPGPTCQDGLQAGGRLGRQGPGPRPLRHDRGGADERSTGGGGQSPGPGGGPADGGPLDVAHLGRPAPWSGATSTCGPFAVNDGEDVWVLPGGLTRVALQEGGLVVNSSQGGGSRTPGWSAAGSPCPCPSHADLAAHGRPQSTWGRRNSENGVQQQQQQQQQSNSPSHQSAVNQGESGAPW